MTIRWPRHPRSGAPRRRQAKRPPISPAVLTVEGLTAVIRVERDTLSANRTKGLHWSKLSRERRAWEASIKNALVRWLDDQARTDDARRELLATHLTTGPLPPAPPQRVQIEIRRIVRSSASVIADDDNLEASVKPVLDSLKALGFIFDDRREWLERARPTHEIVPKTSATVIRVTPWWRLQPAARDALQGAAQSARTEHVGGRP